MTDVRKRTMARTSQTPTSPVAVVQAFNEAWNAGNLEAVLELTSDDCAYDSVRCGAVHERRVGRPALRAAWLPKFQAPSGTFELDEAIVAGDRVVQPWTYRSPEPNAAAVRGVDIFRVDDGRIVEKSGYVKTGGEA